MEGDGGLLGTVITISVTSIFLLKNLSTPTRLVSFRLSIPPSKINKITSCLFFCGRWRNRTPTNGFGNRCSTTKLIAHVKRVYYKYLYFKNFLTSFNALAFSLFFLGSIQIVLESRLNQVF